MALTVRREIFELLRGDLKLFVRKADSGRAIQCWFCPECGTRVYHNDDWDPGMVRLRAGTLDDTSWLAPSIQFWTRRRPQWLQLPGDIKGFDTQP